MFMPSMFAAWLVALFPTTSNAFLRPSTTTKIIISNDAQPSNKYPGLLLLRNAVAEAADPPHSYHHSFEEMKGIESRLDALQRDSPGIIAAFYEPHLKSFSVRPGSAREISVTSTCFALQSIFATGDCSSVFGDIVDPNMKAQQIVDASAASEDASSEDTSSSSSRKIPIRGVVKALLRARWREEDMFQVPLLLYTVLRIDGERSILNSSMDEELCHRVRQLIAGTIENRPKRRSGIVQPMSDYILYLVAVSLAALVEATPGRDGGTTEGVGLGGLPISALPDGAESDALLALTRCVETSYNELCRQVSGRSKRRNMMNRGRSSAIVLMIASQFQLFSLPSGPLVI